MTEMTVTLGSYLRRHLQESVTLYINLKLYLDFFFLIRHISFRIFIVHLNMTIDFRPLIFYIVVVYNISLPCLFYSVDSVRFHDALLYPFKQIKPHRLLKY